jgi:hypothetical protein
MVTKVKEEYEQKEKTNLYILFQLMKRINLSDKTSKSIMAKLATRMKIWFLADHEWNFRLAKIPSMIGQYQRHGRGGGVQDGQLLKGGRNHKGNLSGKTTVIREPAGVGS